MAAANGGGSLKRCERWQQPVRWRRSTMAVKPGSMAECQKGGLRERDSHGQVSMRNHQSFP